MQTLRSLIKEEEEAPWEPDLPAAGEKDLMSSNQIYRDMHQMITKYGLNASGEVAQAMNDFVSVLLKQNPKLMRNPRGSDR